MKYKLCYAHTSFVMDIFLREEFGVNFTRPEFGEDRLMRRLATITEEQALIMKLKFPKVILLPEDYEV